MGLQQISVHLKVPREAGRAWFDGAPPPLRRYRESRSRRDGEQKDLIKLHVDCSNELLVYDTALKRLERPLYRFVHGL